MRGVRGAAAAHRRAAGDALRRGALGGARGREVDRRDLPHARRRPQSRGRTRRECRWSRRTRRASSPRTSSDGCRASASSSETSARGFTTSSRARARARVRVPMRGFVESLNVSVTAAILLHAATQGRKGDLDAAAQRRLYARGLYLSVPHADEVLVASGRGVALGSALLDTHGRRRPLRRSRSAQDRRSGRAQEGLPQARRAASPGQEPREQDRRGALQASQPRLRRARRRQEAEALRRVRRGRACARASTPSGPAPTRDGRRASRRGAGATDTVGGRRRRP